MDSPEAIKSNALLISFKGMTWVMRSSILIFLFMYQSTICGTSVRPRAPPKAEPIQRRPVTSLKGGVGISCPPRPAACDTDNGGDTPATMPTFQRLTHQGRVADALKTVIRATAGQFDQMR